MARVRGRGIGLLWMLFASCQRGESGGAVESLSSALTAPAITFTVTLTTPHLLSPLTVGLASTASTLIGAASKITRQGTAISAITNVGAGGVDAEPDAVFGNLWSTSGVTLKDRVHALGKVYAPTVTRGNGVQIDGGVDSASPLTPPTLTTWTVTYPAAVVSNVVLQPNATASRAPGRFGTFQVASGAKLTLNTGTYFLDSLDLESGSKIILEQTAGPVLIYVRTSAIFRGAFSATSGAAPDLLVGYLNTTEVIVDAPFAGTIVAPSAKITLHSVTGGHAGAFFGRNIEVSSNTTVSLRPGHAILAALPPGSPDTCALAARGESERRPGKGAPDARGG